MFANLHDVVCLLKDAMTQTQQVSKRLCNLFLFVSNFCKNGSEMQTETALQNPLGMESALTSLPHLFSD